MRLAHQLTRDMEQLESRLVREKNQVLGEKDQLVRENHQLQAANTRGQEEVQQLRQQVSDSDIIVQWSLSSPSAVSHEHY